MRNDRIEHRIRVLLRGTADSSEAAIPNLVRMRIEETLAKLPASTLQHEQPVEPGAGPVRLQRSSRRKASSTGRKVKRVSIAAIVALLSASVWVAVKPQTVESMKPVLTSIFGKIGSDAVKDKAGNVQGELPVLTEVESGGYVLRIHEAMFDGLQVSFTYSFRLQNGEMAQAQNIVPNFQLAASAKSLLGPTYKFDNFVGWDDYKIGIVKYYTQKKLPASFSLDVNVPSIGIGQKDSALYDMKKGNWSFSIPVQGTDTSHTVKWNEPRLAVDGGSQFEAVRLRTSETVSELHLKLQIPYGEYESMQKHARLIKYMAVDEQGNAIEFAPSITSSGSSDKKNPHGPGSRYVEDTWFYLEPLPEGTILTITPAIASYKKTDGGLQQILEPITGLSITVPAQD